MLLTILVASMVYADNSIINQNELILCIIELVCIIIKFGCRVYLEGYSKNEKLTTLLGFTCLSCYILMLGFVNIVYNIIVLSFYGKAITLFIWILSAAMIIINCMSIPVCVLFFYRMFMCFRTQ